MRMARSASVAAVMALLLIGAGAAFPGGLGWRTIGHAQLVASSPGAGELLEEAPESLVLVFSEPLEASFSAVDLTDASGGDVVTDAGSVDPADPHQLVVQLPPLPDGVYTVAWESLSSADGHTASGFFSFGVGAAPGELPGAGSTHTAHEGGGPLEAAARALSYLGPLAGVGLPIVAAVVLRRRVRPPIVRLVGAALLGSAVAVCAMLIVSALEADPAQPLAYMTGSRNGLLQLARATVVAVGGAVVVALALRAYRVALAVGGAAALAGIGLQVAAGHAAGLPGVAPVAVQAVHVAAVGVWLSGVAVLLLLAVRPRLVVERPPSFREVVPRFSALALAAIGLVGVTGVHTSWSQTGTLLDLDTDYGRLLALKLVLALGALVAGGLNYVDGGRLLGWLGGFRTRLLVEAGLAGGVLLATGTLSATPPVETARGVAIQPVPDAFGRLTPGMSLELAPGRPGANGVTVTAEGALGNSALELVLERLDARGGTAIPLRHVDGSDGGHDAGGVVGGHGDPAADGAPDRYTASAVLLPPGSAWDASVRVLTEAGGHELSRQRYSFSMGEVGVADGRLRSVLDVGIGVAALLGGGGAVAIGLGYGGWRLPRCEPASSRIALAAGGAVALGLGLLIGVSRLSGVG